MPIPKGRDEAWWCASWNPSIGCKETGRGCTYCYAPRIITPYSVGWGPGKATKYDNVTKMVNGVPTFNGNSGTDPPGKRSWSWPLRWPGAKHPKLGPGKPSLIFLVTTGDLLYERRPTAIIDRICGTIAQSDHIGLVVTRRSVRAAQYFSALDARTVRLWQRRHWIIFSACDQPEFDKHWPHIRLLAERGWFVGVACAPLIGAITLPDDFLQLGRWIICAGECGGPYVLNERVRPMRVKWAYALRDQANAADIPFFMRLMGGNRPIPPDLLIRKFLKATC
jgi:protein gp37